MTRESSGRLMLLGALAPAFEGKPQRSNRIGSTALGILVLVGILTAAGAGLAQQAETEASQSAASSAADFFEPDKSEEIDALLEGEDEMLADQGYFYDAAGRRDPFKSLAVARQRTDLQGPRPDGIPGLLVDEIDLTGIFITSEGPVAQVQSADQDRSYLLREDQQLYDGVVIQITGSEIVFKQYVDDPTALKPFREVVKMLNP